MTRPKYQGQGPGSKCIINHREFGWLNCTPTSTAMAVDRSTYGAKVPTGCTIRRGTGDTSGGTTLRQCASVATNSYGVSPIEIRVGANVCKPAYATAKLKAGHSLVLQGNTGPLIGTVNQSTNGPVNHAVFVNEGRGWDGDTPAEVLVYDPAADGRRAGIDQGPSWWSYDRLLHFAAALEPNGEGTGHLGSGKWYVAIYPDTEPRVTLRYGAVKTVPQPDRTRTIRAKCPVYAQPTDSSSIVKRLGATGSVWVAYQKVHADGSDWYGSAGGTQWVRSEYLDHEGGTS